MSEEARTLRARIHSGELTCHCRAIRQKRGEVGPFFGDYHLVGCQWIAGVLRLYAVERLQEGELRV